jgi:hypothetical protein
MGLINVGQRHIPLPGQCTRMRLYFDTVTQQITVDVCHNEQIEYSGVMAPGMAKPMCPVYKH